MKIDMTLTTGIFLGMVIALHYYTSLVTYMPILVVVTLVLFLKSLPTR